MRTTYVFRSLAALFLGLPSVSALADGPDLVRNGDFSELEGKGKPRDWQVSFTGKGVQGRSSMVDGPEGKMAIKIECTEFPEENPSAWVIFSQNGTVNTERNQNLYISFWVKKEKMKGGQVQVGIMRRQPWAAIARMSVPVTEQWSRAELVVTPHADCTNTRFQIVFEEPGTWAIGMNNKLNRIHFDMLFDYGPAPHKFFVAANAISWFLHPGTSPGVAVNETGPIFAYGFQLPSSGRPCAGHCWPNSLFFDGPLSSTRVRTTPPTQSRGNTCHGKPGFGDEIFQVHGGKAMESRGAGRSVLVDVARDDVGRPVLCEQFRR